ncbi:hypothetical protein [Celerinatantimonas sp. YJH-8]|uniref:hypothetical protein n=1 Tax=Celerinatantimonas sp. YJH-8 TaxID=3228714 RepID=UPI0038C8ACE7
MKDFNFKNKECRQWIQKYINKNSSVNNKIISKHFKKNDKTNEFVITESGFKDYLKHLNSSDSGKLKIIRMNNAWRKKRARSKSQFMSYKRSFSYVMNNDFGDMLNDLSGDFYQKDFLYQLIKHCYQLKNKGTNYLENFNILNECNEKLNAVKNLNETLKSIDKLNKK